MKRTLNRTELSNTHLMRTSTYCPSTHESPYQFYRYMSNVDLLHDSIALIFGRISCFFSLTHIFCACVAVKQTHALAGLVQFSSDLYYMLSLHILPYDVVWRLLDIVIFYLSEMNTASSFKEMESIHVASRYFTECYTKTDNYRFLHEIRS